ncbi:hypothetical protein B0H66DRAFT_556869 [Apodospora peruviana]|uniref:Uncharacterized protein n=1 Tax=Apodospora peruviana TaxID=516989 RepID=A0AAE0I4N4_9PEZI|nr:hypothetical protein B0H66DRAFT_556869 [Apodospora peruviana]
MVPPKNRRKRKRLSFSDPLEGSSSAGVGAFSATVINPHSYTPSTLKNFAAAGLDENARLPSKAYPGFPHRPLPPRRPDARSDAGQGQDDEWLSDDDERSLIVDEDIIEGDHQDDGSDETATAATLDAEQEARLAEKRKQHKTVSVRTRDGYDVHVGGLTATIERCLAEGDIATAKRAFGLLVRSKIYGRDKVDLRYKGYWKLGAEILVREGEGERNSQRKKGKKKRQQQQPYERGYDADDLSLPLSGGSEQTDDEEQEDEYANYERERAHAATNLAKIRAYLEALIESYPWAPSHPKMASALTFYPALFQLEVDSVYSEHQRGLEVLENRRRFGGGGGVGEDDENEQQHSDNNGHHLGMMDDMDIDHDDADKSSEGHYSSRSRRRSRIDRPKDRLRQHALTRLSDIAERMDYVMEDRPFSSDYTLLSLRAAVALCVSELRMPKIKQEGVGQQHEEEDDSPLLAEARRLRKEDRERAKRILLHMKEVIRTGDGLDVEDEVTLERLMDSDDEDAGSERSGGTHSGEALPMYLSLPMFLSLPHR